jgi:hypothetical protein
LIEIVDGLEEKSAVAAGIAKGARKRVLAQLPFIRFWWQHLNAYLAFTRGVRLRDIVL